MHVFPESISNINVCVCVFMEKVDNYEFVFANSCYILDIYINNIISIYNAI